MKTCYKEKRFGEPALDLLGKVEAIVEEYQDDGLILTLRQAYYQCVRRLYIPNNERSYKNLGNLISDARLAGLLDWEAFEDRTRNLESLPHWDSPAEILESAAASYHLDWWEGQRIRPEVWVEKQALENVLERVARRWDVSYLCCRGYLSQSEMHQAALRIRDRRRRPGGTFGQATRIIYLGDHDPSGVDMTRDIQDRLKMFRVPTEVVRIALNRAQVDDYDIPPNPAKVTDSRAKAYIDRFGTESWELDALEPKTLDAMIEGAIKECVTDIPLFDQRRLLQQRHVEQLNEFAAGF